MEIFVLKVEISQKVDDYKTLVKAAWGTHL